MNKHSEEIRRLIRIWHGGNEGIGYITDEEFIDALIRLADDIETEEKPTPL